ncbi:MAG TPA: PilZ domain-containing protein [Pyrinomonadaceae bacterium]|nr:PilZ domain-containing protein [Pyrinomonadaceae bacterium]
MPERLRTITRRLREFIGNRRRAPRRRLRLAVAVSLLDAGGSAHPATLSGHTRDVSESGLGVVLPAIRVGERYLVGEGHTLRVILKLPEAHARLYGTPVRYERLEADQPDTGYLVGIRLTETADEDYAAFAEYLRTIEKR